MLKLPRIRSLQKQMIVFLLLPAALLLLATGVAGFLYVRQAMFKQWQEAALLRLERAAHYIDMRLARPMDSIELMTSAVDRFSRQLILDQIDRLPGVVKTSMRWIGSPADGRGHHMMMRFTRRGVYQVTVPSIDADSGARTVSLVTSLLDGNGLRVATLEVKLSFDYLMEDILRLGWWQKGMACLVDHSGRYIIHTNRAMSERRMLGENGDPLEKSLLAAIGNRSSGTIMGQGHPPDMVAGYHSLSRAPWTIIMFAPGRQVLAPIVRFRIYYFSAAAVLLLLILLLIRINVGRKVEIIKQLSRAAQQVARGSYGQPLERRSEDELGQLIDSYNVMVEGLKERDRIRSTFGLYIDEDIARELLRWPGAVRLGGDKRPVVILMADLRGFTALAESLSPEDTISLLNRYFSYMIREIKVHRGIIVDFVGDGLLVFFDPLDQPLAKVTLQAVCCSLEMQAAVRRLNQSLERDGLPRVSMGIGIHAGQVVVGNIGSRTRVKYGIVGSAVNFTQRIQAKAGAGQVLATSQVKQILDGRMVTGASFETVLKGIQGRVQLHPVKGVALTAPPETEAETSLGQ